jgi:hypothetical protein
MLKKSASAYIVNINVEKCGKLCYNINTYVDYNKTSGNAEKGRQNEEVFYESLEGSAFCC